MQYASIVRILAFLGLVLVAGCGISAGVALVYGELRELTAFATAALFIIVACISVLLLVPQPQGSARPRDGLAVLLLFWLLAPPMAGVAFMLAVPDVGFLVAMEEAASSLTTTGHVALPIAPDAYPVSLVAWRGILHIIGAMASLTAVASIFAAINLGGPGVHRTVLFTIPDGSFFDALPRVITSAALALGATIVFMTLTLAIARAPLDVALSDAVSVATTGLVTPGRAGYGPTNDVQGVLLFIGLLFSTVGLAVLLEVRAGRWRYALRDPELVTLAIMFLTILAGCVVMGERVADGAGWAISELSTSGLPVNASDIGSRIPLTVALLPVVIGGSALSTAGGIKLARVFVLTARAVQEFRTLSFRKAVGVFSFRGRVQPEKAIIAVWVYLVAYVLTIAVLLVLFSLTGHEFSDAVTTAVGTLSNAGHLVAPAPAAGQGGHAVIATLAMVLGRLEVMAALPALLPSFWRS